MADGHWVRKKGGGWLIAVPPEVRRYLGVTHRMQLYWHCTRKGEAVLTVSPDRKAGRPEVTKLTKELGAARNEIEAIRRRDEYRERRMYAEGYAHGYTQAQERLLSPHGPSAEEGRRRMLYRWAHELDAPKDDQPQAAPALPRRRPRPNARTRRAKRNVATAAPAVEVLRSPVLDAPAASEQAAEVEAPS